MNRALLVIMVVLIMFALVQGMVWFAAGLAVLAALISLTESRSSGVSRPFLYPSPMKPAPSGPGEQMVKIKNQPEWDGHDVDLWYGDMVADHWGSGLGRGIGLLR